MSSALEGVVNIFDLEPRARAAVEAMAWEYLAGGAGDEITLRANRTRYDALELKPRMMRDVSALDTSVTLFGRRHAFPIVLAPCGYHGLFHADGERGTARGAAAAGATMVVSSVATTPLVEVAKAADGPRWFQIYMQRDRAHTLDVIRMAEDAGYEAFMLTVDTPILGARDREKRAGFQLPAHLEMSNFPRLTDGYGPNQHHDPSSIYNPYLDPSLTWDTIDWLRAHTKLPVLAKGVLAPEDAQLAIEHGAAAIVVSNHGGRNLDTVPATIDALPAVVAAVSGRVPVLVDGGIRRGTDVLKALALGATAVQVGRPYLWGLAVAGADGVTRAIEILRRELEGAMALCGVTTLAQIDRGVLWREE